MIHHSCDRFKRVIDPVDDVRYVVRMETQGIVDTAAAEEVEDDRDHLLEIHEILERLEDGGKRARRRGCLSAATVRPLSRMLPQLHEEPVSA